MGRRSSSAMPGTSISRESGFGSTSALRTNPVSSRVWT